MWKPTRADLLAEKRRQAILREVTAEGSTTPGVVDHPPAEKIKIFGSNLTTKTALEDFAKVDARGRMGIR